MSGLITLSEVGRIISNIGNEITKNQNILKLVCFDTPNALSQPNLTITQLKEIVGKGTDPKTQQRIFKMPFNKSIIEEPRTELRFFSNRIHPENLYLSEVFIRFQIIVYYTLWDLDNNLQRPLQLVYELLNTLNGFDTESIGYLQLDSNIDIIPYNDTFFGYAFNMKTRTQ